MKRPPKFWRIPLLLTGLLMLSQAFSLPSPVRNAATGAWISGYSMHYPLKYILFAPFCMLADTLTIFSVKQIYLFIAYVIIVLFMTIRIQRAIMGLGLFLAFVAWTVIVPHPQGRLVAQDPNTLLIDFHSHSCVSHDGRKSFTPAANMRWHHNQGYDASFITDHNRVESAQAAKVMSRQDWMRTGYRSLEGEEVSLWRTHLVILGNHERVDNQPYDSSLQKIPLFVQDMHQRGIPVIASLPEYWLYHWGQGVTDFANWGMDGFEIVNSAPKALDFPAAYRRQIVDMCRRRNLYMTGISDNHGYGYATAVWNAMQIPRWQQMPPDDLEKAVLTTLKIKGFNAVTVLERDRCNPETRVQFFLAPLVDLGFMWRSLQLPQIISWTAWIWGIALVI